MLENSVLIEVSSVSRVHRAVYRALTLRRFCVYIQNWTFAAVVQRYFDLHLTIFVEMMEKDAAAVEKDAAKSKHSKAEKSEETQVSVTKRVARESRKRPRECWLNCYVRVTRKEAGGVEDGRCKVGWGKLSQEERDAFKADHAALDEAQSFETPPRKKPNQDELFLELFMPEEPKEAEPKADLEDAQKSLAAVPSKTIVPVLPMNESEQGEDEEEDEDDDQSASIVARWRSDQGL